MAITKQPPEFFTAQTIGSLAFTVVIMVAAYTASARLLPANTSTKLRGMYIWHLADGICHLTLEAAYIYNCFFSYVQLPVAKGGHYPHPASAGSFIGAGAGYAMSPPPFLGRRDRAYGPAFGSGFTAAPWKEYAKADARWARADLTVVSLELLTVFLEGPMALWVAEQIRRGAGKEGGKGGAKSAGMWYWAIILAAGELYGGFMTFAPEWLSGSENLDTSHWMYTILYLTVYNVLWVVIPFWVMYEAHANIKKAFAAADTPSGKKKR